MINNTLTCAYPQPCRSPSRSPRPRHCRTRVHHSTGVDTDGTTKVGATTNPTAATCSIAATAIAAATAAITTGVPASAAGPNMANGGSIRLIQELPQQDYQSIHEAILAKRLHRHLPPELAFVDPIFPPDQSSLTYVYSGDDKYERMVYKRPPDLVPNPVLAEAACGALVRQPVRRWAGRQWLVHALAVVSINPTYMDRLLTGSRHQEQDFTSNYTGTFQFELWRFGEWVQVVVDDYLPVLDGRLAFCPTIGNPPQFWAALLEKAYAKCNKAYEAIELGNPLSALTDFTGAICEHFSPPEEVAASGGELFHLLYRSSVSRSLLVAWRSQHSFRESTIRSGPPGSTTDYTYGAAWSQENHSNLMMQGPNLFIITAVTKFPLRDGRMLELLRVKSPHDPPATWWGDFSLNRHDSSWHRVNPTFMENYHPRECVETNEFWMPFIEFCRHFGDLVICSSTQPYKGYDSSQQGSLYDDSSVSAECDTEDTQLSAEQGYSRVAAGEAGAPHLTPPSKEMFSERVGGIGITVQENPATIKMDTRELGVEEEGSTLFIRRGSSRLHSHLQQQLQQQQQQQQHQKQQQQQQQQSGIAKTDTVGIQLLKRGQSQSSDDSTISAAAVTILHKQQDQEQEQQQQPGPQGSIHSSLSDHGSQGNPTQGCHSTINREESIASNLSNVSSFSNTSLSDTESTNSTSQIKIRLKSSHGRYHGDRPCSAPAKSPHHHRPSKTFNTSMFEARMDFFRPQGSWRTVVRFFGRWDKATSGGPPCDMDSHSRNPRVPFIVTRADTVNEIVPPALPSKCHVLISLLQDYRRGAKTANSLLVNIGFRIYKTKSPEKDEKRHLSKLQVISNVTSVNESREITSRLDLDPGHYLLVPYTYHVAQEGGFLVRILAEKDQLSGKTGCVIS